jgi:CHAT domain-containing protein
MIRVIARWLLAAALLAAAGTATADDPRTLLAEWKQRFEAGVELHQAGKVGEAAEAYTKALQIAHRLFPKERYPNGRPELADNLYGLAQVLLDLRRYAEAETHAREAVDVFRRLHRDRDDPVVASAQSLLGFVLQTRGKYAEAETSFRESLAVYRRLHPDRDDQDVARELLNVAFTLKVQGRYADAEPLYRQSLEMLRRLFPAQDHRGVAISLSHMGGILRARGQLAEAEPLYREALAMHRRLHPNQDHPEVAQELNNLAVILQRRGDYAEAEPLYREALDMYLRLLGNQDDPIAAACLSNLGRLLQAEGNKAEAEKRTRDALAMFRRLHPKQDHPDVAWTLANLAGLLQARGELGEAEQLDRDALAMRRRLYPAGDHPDIAFGLISLGDLLQDRGDYAEAEPLLKEAVALHRRLYSGEGHTDVDLSLSHLAWLYSARGQYKEAEPLLREALHNNRTQIEDFARTRSEGDTLILLANTPLVRDAYVSNARGLNAEPAVVYGEVWPSKGAAGRVYEQRQLAARAAATDAQAARILAELADARRRRADLLLAPVPADPTTRKHRDDDLKELADTIAQRDRDLRPLLPAVDRTEKLMRAAPADLQKILPADAVLVDYLHYELFEQDPQKPGQEGRKRTFSYLAFVLTRDKVTWIDLGPAKPIEDAVAAWRDAITGKDIPPELPAKVRELTWAKVRKEIPDGTKLVYLSPDLALCRVPWAALPGDKDRTILLEDYAVAVIPHAVFLLDKLWPQEPRPHSPTEVLVVGGVAFDAELPAADPLAVKPGEPLLKPGQKVGWTALDWTAIEAKGVSGAAAKKSLLSHPLGGEKATTTAILAALPKARYAHLATHGFFADPTFRSAFQVDADLFQTMRFGERVGAGALSPLVMTGLVFAGANRQNTPGRGVLTGEALIDLDLSGLDLAVLSACETGLGDVAGGEGTFGLQRAFHLAGTRDVVASLWKVPDRATAALMGEFYRNLWEENRTPVEALRRAQLEVYRHPERIPELAEKFRGKWAEVAGSGDVVAKPGPNEKAHPRLWAAFTLSGPGR